MSILPPYTTFISNEIRKAKKRGHSNMSLSLFPFCSVRKYTSAQQNNNLTAVKNPAKNEVETFKSPLQGQGAQFLFANCPQAASISFPRLRRRRALTLCLARYSMNPVILCSVGFSKLAKSIGLYSIIFTRSAGTCR